MTVRAASPSSSLSYTAGVLIVLAAGVVWSFIPLGIRLIGSADVWQIVFYRSAGLLPLIFAVMWWRTGGRPWRAIERAGAVGILGGFSLIAAYAGSIAALQLTSVANAAVLFASSPFLAALLGFVLLGERVRTATWLAMVAAFAGVGMMVATSVTAGNWHGDALALLAALGFAMFTVALRWGRSEDMLPGAFLGGLFTLELAGLVSLGTGKGLIVPLHDMAIALSIGFVSLGFGMVLYTVGSRAVPAGELALLSMTEVVLGPIWVWLVLAEAAKPATLIGGAVLLAAIGFNAASGLRRKPVPVTY